MPAAVMGILNVTPDSFSDGGQFLDARRAIEHGRRLFSEGAAIVDVGGESTRPGAEPVGEAREAERVVPVVEALAADGIVSIDTTKASVARAAVDVGASIINDVSASLHDVAAELGVGWVAMHRRGDPATMQDAPRYDDVVAEVREHLVERAEAGRRAGVDQIWIDPGIGFGKTPAHNLSLLRHLDELVATGYPVVVGTSRKSFIGGLHARTEGRDEPVAPSDRLEGSLASATWAAACGAAVIRAHDVLATVQAVKVVAA